MKTIRKTSIFPSPRSEVFRRIQRLETLQAIAWPYGAFTPVKAEADFTFSPGSTSSYRFKLFGLIPLGIHTIHIVRFDEDVIASREGNKHVPVWNHTITMEMMDDAHTRYTDEVELDAGWKTIFVRLWAKGFYAHRQRKWVRMLKEE